MLKSMTVLRRISVLLSFMMILLIVFSACSKDSPSKGGTPTSTKEDTLEKKNTETPAKAASLTVAIPGFVPMLRAQMNDFMQKNTHIKVTLLEGIDFSPQGITQLAASNQMPDILLLHDMYTSIVNQWVTDIKPYLDADPNSSTYLKNMIPIGSFDGKLYALAANVYPHMIGVNLSMLDEYNIPKPGYDWTIDEFVNILKKSTVKGKSGGIHDLKLLLRYLPAQYNKELGFLGYNMKTEQYEFGPEWVKSVKLIKELADARVSLVEGIDAMGRPWLLEDEDAAAELEAARWQYILDNFGTTDDPWLTGHMATWICGSWMIGIAQDPRYTGFKWDLYPIPVANKGDASRSTITSELLGISSTCKDPAAAYKLLSYLTFDVDGYAFKADYVKNYDRAACMEQNSDVPVEQFPENLTLYYMPPNTDPRAYEVFYKLNEGLNLPGLKFFFDNMETAYCELVRSVPGDASFAYPTVFESMITEVLPGAKTANDVAKELETLLNDNLNKLRAEMRQP